MWSDRYYYLNLYKDQDLSASCPTQDLIAFLHQLPELEQKNAFEFRNAPGFPFLDIILLNAQSTEGWSDKDVNPFQTNLIPVVCETGSHADFERILAPLKKIADFLGWQVAMEETEDGAEDVVLWPEAW